jgi:urease accessory protein
MTATALLLQQRSIGQVKLHVEQHGVTQIRESGASKVRIPRGTFEAILINTGGGVAGGDSFEFDIGVGENTRLTVTSQAAERVYRTLGPDASITTRIRAGANARVFWLPQETILYNHCALQRDYTVQLASGAKFLGVEPVIFGRLHMGEKVDTIRLKDTWRIFRDDVLIHAEALALAPVLPRSKATLDNAAAMATLIYIADDAELHLNAVRNVVGPLSAASAWNGKLIARLIAQDGYLLRKQIIMILEAFCGPQALPKLWTY